MIILTEEARNRVVRYIRKPTEEELSKRKEFMEKLNSRIANREEIESKLVDFISLDFKAPKNKFNSITSINSYDKLIETIKYLLKIDFSFELRTTVNTSLIDENDINGFGKVKNPSNKTTYQYLL